MSAQILADEIAIIRAELAALEAALNRPEAAAALATIRQSAHMLTNVLDPDRRACAKLTYSNGRLLDRYTRVPSDQPTEPARCAPTEQHVATFKAAWEQADAAGLAGRRVEAGLTAVFRMLNPSAWDEAEAMVEAS